VQRRDTDRNLWRQSATMRFSAAPLSADVTADLVIVGGGFTGCSAALEAADAGLSVCLLEAETIGHGGSGRNVGLVNAGLWTPPDTVEATLGHEAGAKLNAALAEAPDAVFRLIETHDIACEATRGGTLHCAHAASGLKDLQNRHNQQLARGGPTKLISAAETAERTGSPEFHGALFDPRAGTIQPLDYCRGLALSAAAKGATLHEQSAVTAISRTANDWIVTTRNGKVTAKALVLATNAYAPNLPTVAQPDFVPVHYFQMATRPLPAETLATILPGGEGCWDTALIMSSFRKDEAGRLIIGSIGALDHLGAGLHLKWAARKLATLFPSLAGEPFAHVWFGRIAMTSDHLPKILHLGDNGYAVFGYSGRGIGPGTVFGLAIAKAIQTGDETHLPLSPLKSYQETFAPAQAAFYETGASLTHLIDAR